jgi:hypothetical protein
LGCIIYELLVGKPPFLTTSIFELTTMIHTKDIEFPHTIFVGDCRSFVKVCFKKLLYNNMENFKLYYVISGSTGKISGKTIKLG